MARIIAIEVGEAYGTGQLVVVYDDRSKRTIYLPGGVARAQEIVAAMLANLTEIESDQLRAAEPEYE
jgi:hypothetical protein